MKGETAEWRMGLYNLPLSCVRLVGDFGLSLCRDHRLSCVTGCLADPFNQPCRWRARGRQSGSRQLVLQ